MTARKRREKIEYECGKILYCKSNGKKGGKVYWKKKCYRGGKIVKREGKQEVCITKNYNKIANMRVVGPKSDEDVEYVQVPRIRRQKCSPGEAPPAQAIS